ncbi:DNA polymerase III subunit gamma/tau [Peredibacter starrii]|uniref:DNA polymerase III subunit gamma/tau n=1 Tax=Peredibacter starrii TaxID=28202 RepID=A0AAX4HQI1_9BACT|nr:DNA polymerase III subunit gamma/tau [Peredibacter starrii]WPU65462.1 DNA polymerase III subunit gamma/tau [Peredibacter starrii]
MAYQVLARKWRPKQFEEVVGQGHVTRTLQNAIKQNKLAHAYLFTGTRGVGKTSIARLFAKAIRCENRKPDFNPCLVCASCRDIDAGNSMDYTEIDGASNNSVDDVRALIENVQYLPTRGTHKIYVIDEVHMLSTSAFNALLKTLEEPPQHAIFILATTDPQKLLGTVISRTQRYDFKNVSVETLAAHVEAIAKAEGITFSSPKIAVKLAELGKGSVRDTLSIFDQVLGLSGTNNVTEESLSQALGLAGTTAMRDFLTGILTGNAKTTSQIFRKLIEENIDLKKLSDQVLDGFYRIINSIDEQNVLYKEEVIAQGALKDITIAELFWIYETLVKDLNWALTSMNPEKVVLIQLQKVCLRRQILTGEGMKLEEVAQGVPTAGKLEAGVVVEEKIVQPVKLAKTWNDFLTYLRQTAPATAANLEHGNLLEEIDLNVEPLMIKVTFPEDAAVFKDFVEEKEIYARLKNHLADFFEMDIEKINFKTQIMTLEEKKDKNFKTKVEIDEEIRSNIVEERRQKILNDPFVKEAEKLFNAKIDKIILKD